MLTPAIVSVLSLSALTPTLLAETNTSQAEQIWAAAMNGRSQDPLAILSEENTPKMLHASLDRYRANLDKREENRAERITEVEVEFDERIENDELKLALNSAIELHAISTDPDTLLASDRISVLVEQAETQAQTAEENENWLFAHGLYYRLNLLFSETHQYEDDAERLAKRLVLLGVYTPKRLHELSNLQRVAEGEDELPPFNDATDDWSKRLKGIDQAIVLRAILQAEDKHINHSSFAKMVRGGLESLRVLVTTSDLEAVFPNIGNDESRERFIGFIDSVEHRIAQDEEDFDFGDTRRLMRNLLSMNKKSIDFPDIVLFHEFGNGAIGELDRFSSLVWPYETERLQRTTEGNFKGVGIQIVLDEEQQLKVVSPLFGTPAFRAGIKANDYIRKIDGESTQGITITQSIERITGKEGSFVTLTIEREDVEELFDVAVERAVIDIHTVRGWERHGPDERDWDWFIDTENHIGYIRLMEFGKDSSDEIRAAVRDMKRNGGLNGLILDLRYNRGGLLDEAVEIVGFWEEGGVVVTQEDATGSVQTTQRTRGRDGIVKDVPTVVLISEGSASASEIVAGALQDYDKAVIVGERSYGKGSVQVVFSLGGGALFRLTTQYYRLPGGRLIHRRSEERRVGKECRSRWSPYH